MEKQLKQIVSESVSKAIDNVLNETSRRKHAKMAIRGKNPRIRTMAIISAENPMGLQASKEYNKQSTNDLIRELHIGHYVYFKTKGRYDTEETSIMVYNITLEDTLGLAYKYNQESVIFIDMTNPPKVSYQYWEGDDHNSPLKLQKEENVIVDAKDDENYYTKIGRNLKFRIPFFDEKTDELNVILEEKSKIYDVDRLITESLDMNRTGKSRYMIRGKLYGEK